MNHHPTLLTTALLLALLTSTFVLWYSPGEQGPPSLPAAREPAPTLTYFTADETTGDFYATAQGNHVQLGAQSVTLNAGTQAITLNFVGALPAARPVGEKQLAATANYFLSNDPHQWREDVPLYKRIRYTNLYPGVDLAYTFAEGNLKSEFTLQPGAALESLRLRYEGIGNLSVDAAGTLHIVTASGEVLQETIPYAYQVQGQQRTPVKVEFRLLDQQTYGFTITDSIDPQATLVIDPLLVYSTFLGGTARDEGWAIAADAEGNTYLTGVTWSTNFPVLNPVQSHHADDGEQKDVFIAKINTEGELVYATYFGGEQSEEGNSIAVDAAGNAYVTGQTFSPDLPMFNAWQPAFGGDEDAYVLKLNPTGQLLWATFIGGSESEEANTVAVDQNGRVYIGGEVYSDDYPLLNPWSSAVFGEDDEDAFLSIFDNDGQLVYSTYISAPHRDQIFRLAVDDQGIVYATGMTSSPDFPLVHPIQSHYGGDWDDAFVLKFDPWHNKMLYSTFLGGEGRDEGWGIDVDKNGNAYITGHTTSRSFPVTNAVQPWLGGEADVFVTKINSGGDALLYSTYIGGTGVDKAWGLALDTLKNVYITGETKSTNFPVTQYALQQMFQGGETDAFVLRFAPNGDLEYASYLGGSSNDLGWSVAVDNNQLVHLTGHTASANFPVREAYQPVKRGSADVFISRMALAPTPTPVPTPTPTPFATQTIGPEGGLLWIAYPNHLTALKVTSNTMTQDTLFTLVYDGHTYRQGEYGGINHFFSIRAEQAGATITTVTKPLNLILGFSENHSVQSDTLALYRLDAGTWVTHNITVTEQSAGHIVAWVNQLGTYGLLGKTNWVYLPVVLR